MQVVILTRNLLVGLLGCYSLLSTAALAAGPAEEARTIAELADFHGGLVVHVGCGDAQLTAALHLADNCTVQGLSRDGAQVAAARAVIRQQGIYGPVSVVQWDGKQLPYVDNLASLVVCEDSTEVSLKELQRIVRPHGAVVVKRDGRWTATVKPPVPGTDQWEQHYHGADNNAVANDEVVGPPRRYQWLGEPQWQRSHLAMPSINSMVSTNARLLTVEDLGSAEHPALPGKQALVARDAFNGIVLWKHHFTDWHPIYIRNKEMPVQLQRRLAAVSDVVYCTPGYTEPITQFEGATGKILGKYDQTAGAIEFVIHEGVLFVVTGDPDDISEALADPSRSALKSSLFKLDAYGPPIEQPDEPRNQITAIDAASGRQLWRVDGATTQGYRGATLGVIDRCVVFATSKELVCLDRASGTTVWRVPAPIVLKGPRGIAVSLVLSASAVYVADSTQLRAFRLTDGQQLWATPATINHHKPPDVFLADGLIWTAAYDASTGRPSTALGLTRMGANGFDPETGQIVRQLDQTMAGPMGHDRCYRNRITSRFYINTATGGSDFLGLDASGREFPNPWIRSTCGIGPLPCNGLYYAGPPSCACANSVMLNGLNAMVALPDLARSDQPVEVLVRSELAKGPAFAELATIRQTAAADDWPAYRHDNARSGSTSDSIPTRLGVGWDASIGTRASAPVIAAGKVFVADVEGHSVCALSEESGELVWRFTADGRVDSPPTFHEGLLLFGSRDGTVYCLKAADGQLAWRFQPLERRFICAYGQPESAWPVCGSILIRNGLAYFAAGRNSFIDGGIFVFAVEPRTGMVVHQRRMYGPYGENGHPIENREVVKGMSIEGFKGDIFIADDQLVYLRHQAFTPDLKPVQLQDVTQRHLIPSHGFLESIPQHRSFWTIDTMLHYDIATGQGGVHGDILVLDGQDFYEVRGYTPGRTESFDPRNSGYMLFAGTLAKTNDPAPATKVNAAKRAARQQAAKQAAAKQAAGKKATAKQKRAARTQPSNIAPSTQRWSSPIPLTGKALVLAGNVVFVAGTPVVFPEDDLAKAYEGRMGGVLWAASAATGEKLAEYTLDAPPTWDGMAVAGNRLFVSLADGRVLCLEPR